MICLRDRGATMEEERVSSGLSVLEMNRQRKKMTVVGGPGGINTPRAQRSFKGSTAVLTGQHCRPSQNIKKQEIFGWLF
jgi:hypothetical protein